MKLNSEMELRSLHEKNKVQKCRCDEIELTDFENRKKIMTYTSKWEHQITAFICKKKQGRRIHGYRSLVWVGR